MSQTKEERLSAVHERAMIRFSAIQSALHEERLQCLQDRRFYSIAGAQWEGDLGLQFENKPRFEMNKIHLAVIRIINEYRNNRVTVDFLSKDGSDDDTLSDTCDGLYRADEQDSGAEEAYDNAFEESVGGGFGAFRLRACYEDDSDEDDDRQRIRIEPIYDADTCVFFDLDAKRQDKADAKYAFVLNSMTPDAYKEKYSDDPSTWPKSIHLKQFDWYTPAVVFVAEYYEIEEKSELVHVYRGLALSDGSEPEERKVRDQELKDDPDLLKTLEATGFREVRQKRIKRDKVHKYILSGARVEEDQGFIAGRYIPVVPTYGKRWFVDNVERCMGHVRLATDAARLKNMLVSMLAEIATFSPIGKPIVTPAQILGHQQMWADDNVKRYPYLLLNPLEDAQGNVIANAPIGYTKPPDIPPGLGALMQMTEQDLQDLLGNQQAGEEVKPNISGKLMELIQTRLDMQSFIYMSNFKKAIKRAGEVWLSMAKDVYVEEGRKMKSVGNDGSTSTVELGKPAINKDTGEDYLENDLSQAKFDVITDVGPTSSSRRSATVRSLTAVLQVTQDPQQQSILVSMIMMNLEGEGMSELRSYYRMQLVKMGVLKPTDAEIEQMKKEQAATPPDPNAQLAQSQAQLSQAMATESLAKGHKAIADAALASARADQAHADTAATLHDIGLDHQKHALHTVKTLTELNTPNPQM